MRVKKLLTTLFSVAVFAFLSTPHVLASSGYISIPSQILSPGTSNASFNWSAGAYTVSPYFDPDHYTGNCNQHSNDHFTGVLYKASDNSVAATTDASSTGCDGGTLLQGGDLGSNFQDNTPYYFTVTDYANGQTWTTPCFEDTGNDNQLVACPNVDSPAKLQYLSSPAYVQQGRSYTVSSSFTDPDSTSWSATVDYGDGSGVQNLSLSGQNFTINHQYTTQGTYSISVLVTDNQGQTSGTSTSVIVAGSGTISSPNQFIGRNTQNAALNWSAGAYTVSPSFDPYDYTGNCSNFPIDHFTGTLYHATDNSVAATTTGSTTGCDGGTILQGGNIESNFQNNTPYYFIVTDFASGQTWTTPCFEDTGNDNQLVACPSNQSPIVNMPSNGTINEGGTYSASGSFTDPDSTSWTATVDYGDGSGVQNLTLSGQNFSLSHQYQDNGTYIVTVKVTDNQGAIGTGTATVIVKNVAPTVGNITAPLMQQINTSFTASASFTDPGVLDTHNNSGTYWDWGDGSTTIGTVTENNGSGSVSDTHIYTLPGVYTITLHVQDKDGGVGTSTFQYVSAYTNSSSFKGSGSFDNPTTANPNTSGSVSFGIQTSYNNNNVLGGNVKLHFKNDNLTFASTSISSLVTFNGKADLYGQGTVNGNGIYDLLVTGIDHTVTGGSNDYVRYRITDHSTGIVVYDSQPGASDTTDPTTVVIPGNGNNSGIIVQ